MLHLALLVALADQLSLLLFWHAAYNWDRLVSFFIAVSYKQSCNGVASVIQSSVLIDRWIAYWVLQRTMKCSKLALRESVWIIILFLPATNLCLHYAPTKCGRSLSCMKIASILHIIPYITTQSSFPVGQKASWRGENRGQKHSNSAMAHLSSMFRLIIFWRSWVPIWCWELVVLRLGVGAFEQVQKIIIYLSM